LAIWFPGPWGIGINGGKPLPESPHQAAIAEPAPEQKRRRKVDKQETTDG